MKHLVLLVTLLSSTLAFAQKVTFLDKNRKLTQKKNAKYVQIIETKDSKYALREYLIEGDILLSETTLKSGTQDVKHGSYKAYYKSGPLKKVGQYEENKKVGIWKEYYENGTPQMTYETREKKTFFHKYWDKEENQILTQGNGTLEIKNDKINEIAVTLFKDSLRYASYAVRLSSNDTIFDVTDKPAEFKKGFKAFYKNIAGTMVYPKEARRTGVEGRVFVEFIVTKEGKLEEVKTVKGIGAGCDEAAEIAIKGIKRKWIPAEFENQKVNYRYILPVTFRLN